ncbi:pyridoxamine 5'-phosphate oxidase family protein [Nocardia sp. SC052]|uniref:pyridoxamine 5'-phosphate oxidase family protein n=1 Tax=Nocardia sichangensis TaxID=3385975 RepID=UPI0039A095A9
MLDPEVRRVLEGTSIAHLASILPDGAPHSVPVWTGTHGDHIAIITGPGYRKTRNMRRDPGSHCPSHRSTTRSGRSSSAAGSSHGSKATPHGRSSTKSRRNTPATPTRGKRSGSSRSSSRPVKASAETAGLHPGRMSLPSIASG